MKKLLFLIFFGLFSVATFADGSQICLQGHPVPADKTNHSQFPRTSLAPLVIEQEGYKLTVPQSVEQLEVILSQNGDIVYEVEVKDSSIIEIPSCFQGDFEIQLGIGNIEYVGKIHF